jgi:hypothetical protein
VKADFELLEEAPHELKLSTPERYIHQMRRRTTTTSTNSVLSPLSDWWW